MNHSWHTTEPTALLQKLVTRETGLTIKEAVTRLALNGQNALPESKPEGLLHLFISQFQSPLIALLLFACLAVFLLGETVDGVIILIVLIFNAIVGTFQEGRAQNTLQSLKHYVETQAYVLRSGEEVSIPDSAIVVGDVIVLTEGSKVPADARLLSANNLKLDEASLTGESDPINKRSETLSESTLSIGEQYNMIFKGTSVLVGNGTAVVVATGTETVIGSIARDIASIDTEIPLKRSIRGLSRILIGVVGVISVALFILGLVKGDSLQTIAATVVSLAVSVIPEGLPIVITLVLAAGVARMSKRNALIKKLQAVEALGQARIIAVDKTGTLTKNELVVREAWVDGEQFSISGVGYSPDGEISLLGAVIDAANHPELLTLGKYAAFSATAEVRFSKAEQLFSVLGDPTEAAIRVFAEKIGFKRVDLLHETPILAEFPFSYENKYHAVVYKTSTKPALVVSGAPEAVLALCTHTTRGGKRMPMRVADRADIDAALAAAGARGLRVVALAGHASFSKELSTENIQGLTFAGMFGMQDVLREEVPETVRRARAAGMKVVMITGDHMLTALAIAKDAGIWQKGDGVLTGQEIDAMSEAELKIRIATVSVYARVTPEHKMRIIGAYKERGETIAMTGDGVNDAPSLVAADLGVAMGNSGTEVAKEAADIILLDDNFNSIISAVEEGRAVYSTIRKVITYLFSTSLGEVLTISVALVLGYPLPLLAAQIIWLNFVTDGFLDVSLAMEPKERGLLQGGFKRPAKYIVDAPMARRMAVMALPMMVGTLILFQMYAETDLTKAWTISLTTLAAFQWLNAWNCRSHTESVFTMNFFSNRYLLGATVLVIFLQSLALYTPFLQHVLHTVPLSLYDWLLVIGVATSIIWFEEARKYLARKRIQMKKTKTVPVPV